LLRRKWIDNNYYGVVPTVTWKNEELRIDIGGEFRKYKGDHYGEVSQFSNVNLEAALGDDWYRYYRYVGKKSSVTGFGHLVWHPIGQPFTIMADIQKSKPSMDLGTRNDWSCCRT
jgi:hypothetical protein